MTHLQSSLVQPSTKPTKRLRQSAREYHGMGSASSTFISTRFKLWRYIEGYGVQISDFNLKGALPAHHCMSEWYSRKA